MHYFQVQLVNIFYSLLFLIVLWETLYEDNNMLNLWCMNYWATLTSVLTYLWT